MLSSIVYDSGFDASHAGFGYVRPTRWQGLPQVYQATGNGHLIIRSALASARFALRCDHQSTNRADSR
jgi:hypothetical protein